MEAPTIGAPNVEQYSVHLKSPRWPMEGASDMVAVFDWALERRTDVPKVHDAQTACGKCSKHKYIIKCVIIKRV